MAKGSTETWTGIYDGFKKWIMQEGSGIHKPNEGALCQVHITLLSDLQDAENVVGYPINVDCEICLGMGIGDMSSALDMCLESMRAGEKCEMLITKQYGVKCARLLEDKKDFQPKFVVHLITFARDKDVWLMLEEEKLRKSSVYKELGTKCFKDAKTHQAEWFYSRALKYVIAIGKQEEIKDQNQYRTQKLLLSLNFAACQLKHKQYRSVITHCTNALNIDGCSAKALFRRGQAFMELQDYELAKSDFEQFLNLEPNNRAVQCQMKLLTEKMKKLDAHYASALGKMFGAASTKH